jgi:2-(1,2-epoxy-1,2-dihydrophenyl)acetyl-CoA isomerase
MNHHELSLLGFEESYDFIELTWQDHVLILTLNRPEAYNAYNEKMIEELTSILALIGRCPKLSQDHKEARQLWDSLRAVIIKGQGGNFNAGGDVKAMKTQQGLFSGHGMTLKENYEHTIGRIAPLMEAINIPLIAQIDGVAIGAGLDLALMCDFRLCTERSR